MAMILENGTYWLLALWICSHHDKSSIMVSYALACLLLLKYHICI